MSTATLDKATVTPEVVDRLEEILKDRWGKGVYGLRDDDPRSCLVGACGLAIGSAWITEAEEAAVDLGLPEIVTRMFPGRVGDYDPRHMTNAGRVVAFNDDARTTLEDVLAVVAELRKAA